MCRALSEPGGASYRFVLSNTDLSAIEEHWEETERAFGEILAEDGKTRDETAQVLADLNKDGRIVVTSIEPHACAIPVVAFDAERRSGWPDVFIWDSVVEDTRTIDTIIRLSPELRMRWVRDFYRGYLNRKPDNPQHNHPHRLNRES